MREIDSKMVTETISTLLQDGCYRLSDDVITALRKAYQREESPAARNVLAKLLENAEAADRDEIPLCQDTGMAVVFLELGQDLHIIGGDLYEAVQEGTRHAYDRGYLRKSVVDKPFSARTNTRDNTPAVIHTSIVPGEKLKITALSKGFGSENMSRLAMLTPAGGRQGVIDFVVKCVDEAGANPCPPVIVGVGIGGSAEKCMLLAKQALLRRVGDPHPDSEIAELEGGILNRVNDLGIGAMGYGGRITALAVHVEVFPTHIASLPVAVNLQCHSVRHREATL
ncbi:MAG: fumarate hydratase [Proteobacteria bacterium]|nr:fumarate hydratase [Pseudomonadota bacterium]MBU1745991.1 fumarate hydratase [Pseudomonadota bacterium]MBU1965383.1 fumarate hydratase [Pseudomonadota bacterium]MBU4371133.1 fumarate hydratase [Pseudomonadota bacterium]MCG2741195.1 fumarate hydratase [Syntrophaceae bacterium]